MVDFYLMHPDEMQHALKVNPQHMPYTCGGCHREVNGRILAAYGLGNHRLARWCQCACGEPSCFIVDFNGNVQGGLIEKQSPLAPIHKVGVGWPDDLARLFAEAALAFTAGAFSASAMLCRKILMVAACREGAEDGKSFAHYVDYITDSVLTYPKAKASVDKIRTIGNDANHNVAFVGRTDADQALRIVKYLLDAIYSLPAA